jgi:excisionase family DNA binding protein
MTTSGPATVFDTLTISQAANRLGVSATTVRSWTRQRRCPVVRIGDQARIPIAWVDELTARGW